MRALLVASVLLFTTHAVAAPRSAAQAKQQLQTAAQNLDQAVRRIRKDPPANTDLNRAQAAVLALKSAIDEGAPFEPKDLGYAKLALAARKQLRTQRDYVEKRRANVHVHNSRRDIGAALKALERAAPGTDFASSRRALTKLEQVLSKGKEFVAKNPDYAKYVKDVRGKMQKHRASIDQRELIQKIEKHKAVVESARGALKSALTPLANKSVSDAQFESAEAAAERLTKRLAEGKSLERDSKYRSYAQKVNAELAKSRRKIDSRWSSEGLARLKAEIEPSRDALTHSLKALRRKPTADQLAEARTAGIVVRKLLERFAVPASKSAAGRQYVRDVKKSLLEVEVDLQKRRVEPARAAVTAALASVRGRAVADAQFAAAEKEVKKAQKTLATGEKLERDDRGYRGYARTVRARFIAAEKSIQEKRKEAVVSRKKAEIEAARKELARAVRLVERRAPTDEQFAEANTAAIVFEKTLAAATLKDYGFQKYVREMRGVLKFTKRTIEKRLLEVKVERQKKRVEAGRKAVGDAMRQVLFGRKVPAKKIKEAEDAIGDVHTMLRQGAPLEKQDRKYAAYSREVKKRMTEETRRIAARRDELAMIAQQDKVVAAQKALTKALHQLKGFGDRPAAVSAAKKAAAAVDQALASGAALEKKLLEYRRWTKGARDTLKWSKKQIAKAELELAVGAGRSELESLTAAARTSLEGARAPDAGSAQLDAATKAVRGLKDAIARGTVLEAKDRSYRKQADRARRDAAGFEKTRGLAKQAMEFRKGPAASYVAARSAARDAADSKNLSLQRDIYRKASAGFLRCQRDGKRMVSADAEISNWPVLIDGRRVDVAQVVRACEEEAKPVESELKRIQGLLAFHEGPAKHFQDGQAQAKSQKKKALTSFESCISSGKILLYKNPELKKKKFDVGGQKITLPTLVNKCVAQAKRLRE